MKTRIIDDNSSLERIGRREFIKYSAMMAAGLALNHCAGIPRFEGYNPHSRTNRNFKGPGYQVRTFHRTILEGWTPGIDYGVAQGTPMTAVAEGFVHQIKSLEGRPGRAGGQMVIISHDTEPKGYTNRIFCYSYYAHIEDIKVEPTQKVARGQIVGRGGYHPGPLGEGLAKLMFKIGGWKNPDNYGLNHSYMDYWDGKTNLEVSGQYAKWIEQIKLLLQFIELCTGKDISHLIKQKHTRNVFWSSVEQFRYLEYLYAKHPEYFSATKETIDRIRKEFYQNQPIILTLPFRNPKLKK